MLLLNKLSTGLCGIHLVRLTRLCPSSPLPSDTILTPFDFWIGLRAYWDLNGKKYEVYYEGSRRSSARKIEPSHFRQFLTCGPNLKWVCRKQHNLDIELDDVDLNRLGEKLVAKLGAGRASGLEASVGTLMIDGSRVESFRPIGVFDLVGSLIYRVHGVRSVNFIAWEQHWLAETYPGAKRHAFLEEHKFLKSQPYKKIIWERRAKPSSVRPRLSTHFPPKT